MHFDEAYKKLNAAQKMAVDHIEGPTLVIAGPGTGKTQLLSTRVANILRKTDTDARNILCLTFTNKAAINMRERLQKLTDGEARNVNIKTFHAFAAEIMNSHSQYFWNGANLTSAPEAIELNILESILKSLPLDNPYSVRFFDKLTMLGKAQKQIARSKEAGLTPDKLRAILRANLAYIDIIENQLVEALTPALNIKKLPALQNSIEQLPSQSIENFVTPLIGLETKIKESLAFAISQDELIGKTTNTGIWKKNLISTEDGVKGMHRERKSNQTWLWLADIYEQYRQTLHQSGYYDYSDMLLEVIEQIEKNPDLKSSIQEQYNYVLIDEFQDSNAAQLRLAHLVADHADLDNKPNIMAVGDDDQSIYGFNGAELNSMLHFNRTYGSQAVKTIVLAENYRSTQAVLDTAKTIIENSKDRLVNRLPNLTKNLRAMTKDLANGQILSLRYTSRDQQLYEVAKHIDEQLKSRPDINIAVLARSHKSLEPLASQLVNRQIAVNYERQQNILQHEAVQLVINICRALKAILDGDEDQLNMILASLLRHPMFVVEAETLWQLAVENRRQPHWLSSLLDYPETKPINEWLHWLANEATYQPLPIIIEHIIGIRDDSPQTYLKHYFTEDQPLTNIYLETLSALKQIRNLVQEFTSNSVPTLQDFLQFIEIETNNQKIISSSAPLITPQAAVELLSVHKAKGLEFDTVYIIDTVEKDWQPSNKRESVPLNLPLQPPLETDDEYARLMYVAATRAKQNIYFTNYLLDDNSNQVLTTPLIRGVSELTIEKPDKSEIINIEEAALNWPRLNVSEEKIVLVDILQKFTINATNLISFLDVGEAGPQVFLERNLLRLPQVKSTYMSHGTAMHAALELAQKLVNLGRFNLENVKQEYARALKKEFLPAEYLKLQIVQGEKSLDKLFNKFNYQLQKGSLPERSLSSLTVGAARIGGKLDRIDFVDPYTIRIVDYKTGSGLTKLETKDKTKAIKAWKHKLQLTFYALLAQNHPEFSKYKKIESQMAYIETKFKNGLTLSYYPSQQEIDRLALLIQAVWHKVQTYDLPDISRYSNDIEGIKQFEQHLIDTYVK